MTSKLNYIRKSAKYIIGAAVLATGLSSAAFGLEKDNDGYYLIRNKAELKEFAEKVNSGEEPDAHGKLMDNIVFNESVIENGELRQGVTFNKCEPIGTDKNPFKGKFLGNNKIITGVYINKENNDDQGLFGVIGEGGKVKNVKVSDSYIKGSVYTGGIAGENKGEIENCTTSNSVIIGNDKVGGNVGNNEGTIAGKCENSGVVTGKEDSVGGNIGWQTEGGTIAGKCENSGVVTGEKNVGGNVGWNEGIIEGECNNIEEVKGQEDVGGNVGSNDGTIEGICNNSGAVKGSDKVGGNVGGEEATITGECNNSGIVTIEK